MFTRPLVATMAGPSFYRSNNYHLEEEDEAVLVSSDALAVSDGEESNSLEVTHDDYRHYQLMMNHTQSQQKPPSVPGRRLLRSLRNPRHRNGSSSSPKKKKAEDDSSPADSTNDMRMRSGRPGAGEGVTVASNDDTVLVSNRRAKMGTSNEPKLKKPWHSLKRMINKHRPSGSDRALETGESLSHPATRERTRSEAAPSSLHPGQHSRKRFDSAPGILGKKKSPSSKETEAAALLKRDQSLLDDAIRGRLDGMDVLSLGAARLSSIPHPEEKDILLQPITQSLKHGAHQMVADMIWTSGGKEYPEMVLEGFIPSGDDRWMVRVNATRPETQKRRNSSGSNKSSSSSYARDVAAPTPSSDESSGSPSLALSSMEESCTSVLCGSVAQVAQSPPRFVKQYEKKEGLQEKDELVTPVHELLKSMWGSSPPPPLHMSRVSTETSSSPRSDDGEDEDENDVLHMAAACSVPIDIDEDTFIIDTAYHLQAVHDICAKPLKDGKFDDAVMVFRKIVKGLDLVDEKRPRHLVGSTLHNTGIVQMWQGKYQDALDSFEQAVTARKKILPKQHPDIAVSLMREGMALFALESFDLAAQWFESALEMAKTPNATRAKLLNNLGVAHYQRRDFVEALVAFTAALEIQRSFLEGPVRRAALVFDASITLSNMGKVYLERKDYDTALYVYEEALLLQTSSFRKDHDIVVVSLGNLAYTKAKTGDTKKALQIYKGVLRSQETKFGRQSREAIETIGLMGLLHQQNEEHREALKCLTTVLKWQQTHLKAHNPAIRKTKETIKKIERSVQTGASAWI